VWIVEVGDAGEHGSFDEFRAAIGAARVEVEPRAPTSEGLPAGFDVSYDSPSRGPVSFGSDAPLTVDGAEVAQRFDRRYDNPWTQVDWKATSITIADDDGELVLDLAQGTRRARSR
jgi:hypothetical protein